MDEQTSSRFSILKEDSEQELQPIIVKPENPYEKPEDLVTWTAHSRVYQPKNSLWVVGFLTIGAIFLAILLLLQQWTFALAIVAFSFAILALNNIEPPDRSYTISTLGVRLGSKLYEYKDLKWFWFAVEDNAVTLTISTYMYYPYVLELPLPQIPTQQINILTDKIEQELLKHIPYHEENKKGMFKWLDSAVDRVTPWLPQSAIEWYEKNVRSRIKI